MAILPKKEKEDRMMEIDLTGPDGNAFVLMGIAKNLARQLGLDGDLITQEMRLGDYEDLLKTFDSYFGDFVILYR
jgi:hypothetical protein